MRWVGRATALLFLIWLAVVILGGLGVGPVARLPLGSILRPSAGPPPLRHELKPAAPAPADLVPAIPAPVAVGTATTGTTRSALPGKSAVAPGHTKTTNTTTSPGKSAVAPGHTKTTNATTSPGKSGNAPGHTTTTARGKSAATPGHAKRTTTTTATTTVPGKRLGHGTKP
jgi:hypothetical protein